MGHINTDFKRRYFLLHGGRLAYFDSVSAAAKGKAKGLVTVVKISHVPNGWPDVPPDKVTLAFRFDTAENKPFVVYADSLDAKLAWMRALAESTRRADGVPHSAIEDIYRTEITAGMEAGRASQGASRCVSGSVATGAWHVTRSTAHTLQGFMWSDIPSWPSSYARRGVGLGGWRPSPKG